MPSRSFIAHTIATAMVNGPWDAASMAERSIERFGRRWRWLPPLAKRVTRQFATPPRCRRLTKFICADDGFDRAMQRWQRQVRVRNPLITPDRNWAPQPALAQLDLPKLMSTADLASWLGVDPPTLMWLANRGDWRRHGSHFTCRWHRKRGQGHRLIEAPKMRLKAIQKLIYESILCHVPVHETAHGFAKGRSIHTFVTPHVAQAAVCRVDLADFFLTVGGGRIYAIFRSMGYPEGVAEQLTALCTHRLEPKMARCLRAVNPNMSQRQEWLLRGRHLPTGAPTSPVLANLSAWHLDQRLSGLAAAWRLQYSRYADDLAFSGRLPNDSQSFLVLVYGIILDEGFAPNYRKTRIMRASQRQRLAGMIVNQHPNFDRQQYDQLKAILTNCIRQGPSSQNRNSIPHFQAHLAGRIAWCKQVSPGRAERLERLFAAIDWER